MVKSALFILLAIGILIPICSALDINKTAVEKSIISELDNPIIYNFQFLNSEKEQLVEIYSLVDINFEPEGKFEINKGDNEIEVKIFPGEKIRRNTGDYRIEYFIWTEEDIIEDKLPIEIIKLEDVFEIKDITIKPSDKEVIVIIKNKKNVKAENIRLKFESAFFNLERVFNFQPNEEKKIVVELDKEKMKKLMADTYIGSYEISGGRGRVENSLIIKYLGEEKISTSKENKGIFIREMKITKINEGNLDTPIEINMKKDIISRLFNAFSVEPDEIQREGFFVRFIWRRNLLPGQSFYVVSKVNYWFPLIIIILIFVILYLIQLYYSSTIILTKRVKHIRTKGGEFALKIILDLKARKKVRDIEISDSIPLMTKLYDKFGKKPDKIDHDHRKIYWRVGHLNKGEKRIYSYIIYSKLRTVGKFELPPAKATFEHDGKRQVAFSNRTSFISDTIIKE